MPATSLESTKCVPATSNKAIFHDFCLTSHGCLFCGTQLLHVAEHLGWAGLGWARLGWAWGGGGGGGAGWGGEEVQGVHAPVSGRVCPCVCDRRVARVCVCVCMCAYLDLILLSVVNACAFGKVVTNSPKPTNSPKHCILNPKPKSYILNPKLYILSKSVRTVSRFPRERERQRERDRERDRE